MSMREKAKSMWEKSQMSVGKAMSSAVTNLAGYVSSMWNKNSETGNQGDLLTGKPENPNNQLIIEPRTESTSPITIGQEVLPVQWNEGTVANTASITPTISVEESGIQSNRKGMEGVVDTNKPVKQITRYIDNDGKLTEGSYLIKC